MRWDELRVEQQDGQTLPGYRDPAVVRTFDAPEAMDVRFYEVRARSVLNRVPAKSRVPFRWTINPYRGCTHACSYCSRGGTPVLMGDGKVKAIEDINRGDYVYGTVGRGACRRYRKARVLDHWSTIKPAFRVILEDGTQLVTSADHRFLTPRGRKHVIGWQRGAARRPHLTLDDTLLGTGHFAEPPEDLPGYRRGYLCGLIRGGGHLGSYSYEHPSDRRSQVDSFRLALADLGALRRAKRYLEDEGGVLTQELAFSSPAGFGHRPPRAIRTPTGDSFAAITDLVRRPRGRRPEWCTGFLAGIFDAQGNHGEALRISNTDPEIVDWVASSLRQLAFRFVVEDRHLDNGLRCVRLLGGLREKLRFFHATDPAGSRKLDIEDIPLKSDARLRVESIEPLGKGFRLYDITTETGDFIADGVVNHNCFARPTHTYLDFNAGRDFEREIVVKVNAPEVARAELSRPRWKREHVAMGTNTDPYQWVEGRYRLMPGIWEALRDSVTPASILTKSPLLLRDIALMKQVGESGGVSANLSIPTLEEKAWRATEPHTPHPRARLEAVAELNRAGVPCGVLIAPLMPGVNDDPERVEEILELCTEAGAVEVGGIALHLRGEVKQLWFEWLAEHRPDLVPRYRKLYRGGAYAAKEERARLSALARGGARRVGPRRFEAGPAVTDPTEPAPRSSPGQGVQTSLF